MANYPPPPRIGYIFNGWFTDATGGSLITSETIVSKSYDHTIYAQWTANSYTVIFDGNGAEAGEVASITAIYNESFELPSNAFTHGNQTFTGWNSEADGSGVGYAAGDTAINLATEQGASVTLYAQWISTCVVTFNTNGGDALDPSGKTVMPGEAYGELPTPTRTGYTFNGWFTLAEGGSEITSTTPVQATSDHSIYAQWTVSTYTVTYNGNGGSASGSKTVTYGSTYGTLASASRTGYNFTGWNTEANGSGEDVTDSTVVYATSDHTLYAQWQAKTYTVTWQSMQYNTGTVYSSGAFTQRTTCTYGSPIVFPTTPVIQNGSGITTNRSFAGWYTAASGGTQISGNYTATSNKTYYGHWQQQSGTSEMYFFKSELAGTAARYASQPTAATVDCGGIQINRGSYFRMLCETILAYYGIYNLSWASTYTRYVYKPDPTFNLNTGDQTSKLGGEWSPDSSAGVRITINTNTKNVTDCSNANGYVGAAAQNIVQLDSTGYPIDPNGYAGWSIRSLPYHKGSSSDKGMLAYRTILATFAATVVTAYNNGGTLPESQAIIKNLSLSRNVKDGVELSGRGITGIAANGSLIATETTVTDTISSDYELQTASTVENALGETLSLTTAPEITVEAYEIDHLGTRTTSGEVLERVTFNATGTEAYSSITGNAVNIMDASGNISASLFEYDADTKTFTWNAGDCSSKEVILSYYVYLKGSMEGDRGSGVYETGKASVEYRNYTGELSTQEIIKEGFSWGDAYVTYEYYLVNENGKPVNYLGQEVDITSRVIIYGPVSTSLHLNGTDADNTITASDFAPYGYELHISDAAYCARPVSSGAGSSTIYGTVENSDENSTVQISNTTDYARSRVAFGVVYEFGAINDVLALDFAKTASTDVTLNDTLQRPELVGIKLNTGGEDVAVVGSTAINTGISLAVEAGFTSSVEGEYGRAFIEDGKFCYTPLSFMSGTDRFILCIKTIVAGETCYAYSLIRVLPANTIYYEDTFTADEGDTNGTTGIYFSGQWETILNGSHGDGRLQSGTDDPFGYDESYDNDLGDSNGSVHFVTAATGYANAEKAVFTFKGTGFDIIGRTTIAEGKVIMRIIDVDAGDELLASYLYQLGGYDEDLYQIPIISWTAYGATYGGQPIPNTYSTYRVELLVITTGVKNGVAQPSNVYVDAIRIYEPMGSEASDNTEFQTAEETYIGLGEGYPVISEIKNIIATTQYGGKMPLTVEGFSYSNNEIYLASGQTVSFSINTTALPADVQIGMKLKKGGTAMVTVGSNERIQRSLNISTNTPMYYSILGSLKFEKSSSAGVYTVDLVVTNTSSTDAVLSLTNIKITFMKEPPTISGDSSSSVSYTPSATLQKTTQQLVTQREAEIMGISGLPYSRLITGEPVYGDNGKEIKPGVLSVNSTPTVLTAKLFGNVAAWFVGQLR